MKRFILLLAVVLAGCAPAPVMLGTPMAGATLGRTYFVATNGNDANPGTESAQWATLQKASNSVNPGDTVLVQSGTYAQTFGITADGIETAPITFRAVGVVKIVSSNWAVVRFDDANYVTFDGFEIIGSGQKGIDLEGGSYNTIKNCKVSGVTNVGIFIASYVSGEVTTHNTVEGCTIFNNGWEGVYIKSNAPNTVTSYNSVINNTFYGNKEAVQNTAQNGGTAPDHTTVRGNVAYGNNGASGTWGTFSLYGDNLLVENNTVYNNTGGSMQAIIVGDGRDVIVRNNVVYGNRGVNSYDSQIRLDGGFGIIANNTVYNSATHGIYINAPTGPVTVTKNVIEPVASGKSNVYLASVGNNATVTDNYIGSQLDAPCGYGAGNPCAVTPVPVTATQTPVPPTRTLTSTPTRTSTPTMTSTPTATSTPTVTSTMTPVPTVTVTTLPTATITPICVLVYPDRAELCK